jgi:CRP/FNR family cyclic AMP-dependent transcriptional regulator
VDPRAAQEENAAMSDGRLRNFIDASPWAACLTPQQMDRVQRDATMRTFEAGSTVCLRGSPAMHWLAVVEGMLKVDTIASDGRSTTFAGVPSGAWFGEGSALKGEPRPYAVVAIRDSHVAFMPRDTLNWLIDENPGFARWVINQLNARLAHYVAMVENSRLHDMTARVSYALSELFNPQLYPVTGRELGISQEEIARLCGLSRQNVNRELHKLEEAGLLKVRYGVVEIIDLQGLKNFSRPE